jgi:hypothetical protein
MDLFYSKNEIKLEVRKSILKIIKVYCENRNETTCKYPLIPRKLVINRRNSKFTRKLLQEISLFLFL